MTKIKDVLEKVFLKNKTFIDTESKEIDYIKIKDSADNIDEELIEALISNKTLKEKFFTKIKDVYVFNINDFKFFLDENKVNNSYTQYANKIGLSNSEGFIKDTDKVVLDFPFKDCVLEGGQSSEEGTDSYFEWKEETLKDKLDEDGNKIKDGRKNVKEVDVQAHYEEKKAKRKEVFFNQVLAKDEIDRLYDRKALTNWKRFTKGGEKEVAEIKRDSEINKKRGLPEDTITENLIIKGNNLLALHSLKSEFTAKVKLIYIDPPYNTKNDSFCYNDKFNHSTWLTFMRNRLDVAKKMLTGDGSIFVQCDDNEQAYLTVLLDEIFGVNNKVNTISVNMSTVSGNKIKHTIDGYCFPKTKEYLLLYAKNKKKFKLKVPKISKVKWDSEYNKIIPNWSPDETKILASLTTKEIDKKVEKYQLLSLVDYAKENNIELTEEWKWDNAYRIFAVEQNESLRIIAKKETFSRDIACLESSRGLRKLISTNFNRESTRARIELISAEEKRQVFVSDNWIDMAIGGGISYEGSVTLKNGKKPEKLIKRIIESCTKKNDLILDYHLGTGTACAVAHKTGRQYIGIEQLSYGRNDSVVRLNNVINGDSTGISAEVNWKGGGEFLYCELAKWNEQAKEEINKAKDYSALVTLLDTLYEKYFLNYNVKIKDFKEKIILEENFINLSLEEQKRMFLTMLDLNQMYVQESEMASAEFGISKEDQELTKKFYKEK